MRKSGRLLILLGTCFSLCQAQSGTITSVAGTQSFYRNLNGPAISAPLGFTQGMYADGNGNVYIADASNNVVVALAATGIITLIAGNGTAGFSGDNGPATQAQLNSPHGLAMDVPNNILYIADTNNSRIRKLNTLTGVISTAAGTGTAGFSGDGGSATSATLNNPLAIAINSQGALFIADSGNACIRRLLNGTISTVAGIGGSPGFSGDGGAATSAKLQTGIRGVFADIAGNIYFSDTNNNRVRAFQVGNTIQTYIGTGVKGFSGDNGPPSSAQLSNPAGLTMDATNTFLLIADAGNARIRSATNSTITSIAGTVVGFGGDGGAATSALFNSPIAVVVDPSNDIYIADQVNERVREMRMGGTIATVAGNGNFEFFGDNGQATSALLGFPSAVAFDSQGSFFFTEKDNNRVRKVTSGGIISTIAGNGRPGYSGDGGQATSASLNAPLGTAVDSTGAVYFSDTGNNVVRKVTTSGTISTVAGNGQNTFSGDGGQATSASLSQPRGIAVDSGGYLLIADYGNSRVRMVTPQGVISTVAGNGGSSFSGDGSATAVAVPLPYSVAWFAPGNFYVADFSNRVRKVTSGALTTFAGNGQTQSGAGSGDGGSATSVPFAATSLFVDGSGNVLACAAMQVRKITPAGILSTLAGSGNPGITGDGGIALSANMQCEGLALDAQGNIFIADGANNRVRKVSAVAAPVLTVTPTSLTFTAVQGTNPAPQQLSIGGPAGSSWQAVVSPTTPAGYLTVSPASGLTPGTLSVQVITDNLFAAGTYSNTITIGSATVNVSVTLTAAPTGQLTVPSSTYSDSGIAGNSKDQSGVIFIGATGSKPIPWTASSDPASKAWLTLNTASGTATPGAAAFSSLLSLTLNAQTLGTGVFTSTITINPGGIVIPVKFTVSAGAPRIVLSQTGLQFSTVQGSASVPAQSVTIVNGGSTTANWTADSSFGFLSVSPASGTSVAGQTPPAIQIRVNPANLTAGTQYGFIRVQAPGADNSPQYISVVFNVLASTAKASSVTPLGLVFVSAATAVSQTLSLSTAASSATATVTVSSGTPFSISSSTVNLAPSGSVTVTANPGSLAPGVYPGTATVVFTDGSQSQDVKLLLVIPGTSEVSAQSVSAQSVSPQATCTPKQLALVMRQLGSNFSSPVAWPVSLEAQVVDDCGNFPNNATVVATFSNGDAPLALVNTGSGIYTGTWKPASANSTNVTIRALLSPLASATTILSGQVNVNPAPPPAVGSGGVVNAASFSNTGGVAPGSIISVFGNNLATGGNNQNGGFPLPSTLGGIRLTMGGKDMPLFFSNAGQVNAQVPSDLQPASQAQVLARYFSGSTEIDAVPEPVTIGVAQPGIFQTNAGVSTQGVVLNNPQLQVVDATHPAAVGDVLTIYCTGLGVTTPVVATGAPAPSGPPATVSGVTATIGGINAPVQFAGLTPGLVGLYQVNVQVPPGVTPGASVKLALLQSGVSSNTVTLGVK